MKGKIRKNIKDLLKKVEKNDTGVYSKIPVLIAVLNIEISDIIGDRLVHISEFVIAKIKGLIPELDGHPEINNSVFIKIPKSLNNPLYIYTDTRTSGRRKFLFVADEPMHLLVVEIMRLETGISEINSIFPLGQRTLKQLGSKFQAVLSPSH
jgi:hypothetical protein